MEGGALCVLAYEIRKVPLLRELIQFIEAHGNRMQERFQGYSRADVQNVGQFFLTLGNTILTNMPSAHLKKGDEDRTVGVNTGYVFSSDYTLEDPDREFLIQRGYNATKAFLQYYVVKNPQTKRKQMSIVQSSKQHLGNYSEIITKAIEVQNASENLRATRRTAL